ncbi:CDP-diacylglycerol---serine O-phosphatidyltransferase [Spirochaetota bacterium]|nr:CDP-diacylglycerol---serine O-phosphatidyltransferase [Spirochaetota bacterium]
MFKKLLYLIPNTLTLVSLFLGFSSILFSIQAINDLYLSARSTSTQSAALAIEAYPERFLALAGILIFLASLFDFLDGFSARYLKAATPMGKQLDSLVDFVSFGLAPAVLFFTITLIAVEHIPEAGIYYSLWDGFLTDWVRERIFLCKLLAFILPSCTMFRLARFNLIQEKRPYFEGLPSTYAGALMGIILTFNFYLTPLANWIGVSNNFTWLLPFFKVTEQLFFNYFFLIVIYITVSLLMVTRIRFYKIEAIIASNKGKTYVIPLFIVLAILSALFFKYVYVLVGLGYILFSMVYFILRYRVDAN